MSLPRHTKIIRVLLFPFLLSAFVFSSARAADVPAQLLAEMTNSDFAYNRLAVLCDKFGPRFSGSTNLEAALDWIITQMKEDGLENVRGEQVMVPHWVRGAESAELLEPRARKLPMLGLGGSIATPPEGITAEVFVVKDFADLSNHVAEAKNRIVLFNLPFTTYGETVKIRSRGAVEAAKAGAVASLIRSVTPYSQQTPHTGMMSYKDGVPQIPHAAITVEDAEMMQRMQDRGEKIVVRLKMSAKQLPDSPSRNVVAEVRGSEKPEEIVVVSGHIDSWDVGQGAMDDGGGAMVAWEAARVMHKLGLRPRRTVRVVLWTNEENGVRGGIGYEEQHHDEMIKHVAAMESDIGTFKPTGFSFVGSDAAREMIRGLSKPLASIGAGEVFDKGGDTDIGEMEKDNVPLLALLDDETKYFWYHHTEADTIDKLNPREVAACASAMAVMAWQVADSPIPLPRGVVRNSGK